MSTTTIYRLGREPGEIGETKNSWRGAMYVWNDIAKRYFGFERFPFNENSQAKVWNAHQHVDLPLHETIVLLSTMDVATVKGADVPAVIAAFEQYGREHPASSLGEQAEILRTADIQPDDVIGWSQTSVSGFWGARWNEEKEDDDWYDPASKSDPRQFDLYAAALEYSKAPA